MINSFFSDSQTEAYMKLVAACFPYVTIGFLWHPALTIAAGCVGGVALIAFLIRIMVLFGKQPRRNATLDHIVHGLFFPYAFSLAFAVGIAFDSGHNGNYDFGWYGIWFCLFLAVFIVVGNLVVAKEKK